MKKGTKIGIIIGSAVLAVIVALVLVLSLTTTKPLESLSNYDLARVYQNSTSNSFDLTDNIETKKSNKLRSLLKNCSFSTMQAIFSGRADTVNKVNKENGETVKLSQEELVDGKGLYSKYTETTLPKIKLSFNEVKKAKIGSKTYEFDTVEILVANTHGEIREITCIAWDNTAFDVQNPEEDPASFEVFRIYANTTELYNFILNECKR
jgi:hypothetical protein